MNPLDADGAGDSAANIYCLVCNEDITELGIAARNAHTEECLARDSITSELHVAPEEASASKSAIDTATLNRLADCPVCGAEWSRFANSRLKHVGGCALQHNLARADLVALIGLFRESLSGSSSISASITPSNNKDNGKVTTTSCGILSAQNRQSLSPLTNTSKPDKKPRVKKSPKASISKRIDRWFGKQPSPEIEIVDSASSACDSKPSNSQHSLLFEIESDEDFQGTKIRMPLRQTCISVTRRAGKRKQEFLDELDDDLNEAKALSLSLKRASSTDEIFEDRSRSSGNSRHAKRRGAGGVKEENLLAKSDILASEEAQQYIRQRAVALACMDEETMSNNSFEFRESPVSTGLCSSAAESPGLKLWQLGSLSKPAGNECCPIFEKYKMRHNDHTETDDCLGNAMDYMINALAFECTDANLTDIAQIETKNKGLLLRGAYVRMLQALHLSFDRQIKALRCASWADDARQIANSAKCSEGDSISYFHHEANAKNKAIAPSLLHSPPSFISRDQSELESNHYLRDIVSAQAHQQPNQQQDKHASLDKQPNYTKMSIDELKRIAAGYGLRANTPKRLLVHQLGTIWERTHGSSSTKSSSAADKEEVAQHEATKLYPRFREYIRSQRNLLESIICYQVLDFNATYQDINRHVHCHRWMLRKFFDLEGISYSSYQE
ncbi:hypothetical protein GGI25_004803 [Coemansia spiralis]|uniref:SAP domain-containing protein n=2 Tax=Coemansia TaxID=4863 RepID=A0A9W8G3T2_9FUNG|nr:hypothetical protein EDC05_004782 [Coemansia umbellata]KAJ2620257.1 hypothetical protein GGI26_005146 [Coemansia sp. RSA 1358]KAJ2673209.1 hypothetical protein GGI25_004803 [Coemansia spiralis]